MGVVGIRKYRVTQPLTVVSFAMKGNDIFAGSSYGYVYKSSNNGSNWDTTGLKRHVRLNALVVKDSNIFAGTWNNGVLVSSDTGITWTADNIG